MYFFNTNKNKLLVSKIKRRDKIMEYFDELLKMSDWKRYLPPYVYLEDYRDAFKEYFISNYPGDVSEKVFVAEILECEIRHKEPFEFNRY
uniref:Uncharacterized protein n=2 Tax=Peptostreptococcaceae TaxID=186804 RepID=A0A386JBZ2_CLODI|nr:hypothetical protein pHSJD-312_00076 [Clostridioides difficile]